QPAGELEDLALLLRAQRDTRRADRPQRHERQPVLRSERRRDARQLVAEASQHLHRAVEAALRGGVHSGLRGERFAQHPDPQRTAARGSAVEVGEIGLRRGGRRDEVAGPRPGAQIEAGGRGPASSARPAAASRTLLARIPSVTSPIPSLPYGPGEITPREGLRPRIPQQAAGMRTEPPPSEPWASGTTPAATAAAAPPLEPPAVRRRSQGVRAGAPVAGSV